MRLGAVPASARAVALPVCNNWPVIEFGKKMLQSGYKPGTSRNGSVGMQPKFRSDGEKGIV